MEHHQSAASGLAPRAADSTALDTGSDEHDGRNLAQLHGAVETIASPEEQIRDELTAIELGVGEVLARILRCGNLFRAQKARLRHGEFGPWLEREFPQLERRTISRWMRAAEVFNEQRKNGHGVSNSLTLRKLLGVDDDGERQGEGARRQAPAEVCSPPTPEALELEHAIEILSHHPQYMRRYKRMVKELREAEIVLRNASARVVAAARKIASEVTP